MKINYTRLFTAIIGFLACAQFSQNASVNVREKPKINVMATICERDTTNNCFDVENLTISGKPNKIPVYSIPQANTLNPETNTTLIDFDEINKITVPINNDMPSVRKFGNRDYIEIEVILKDATKNKYLIDRASKLYCDRITGAGPQEKIISFEAINYIIINDVKENIEPKKQLKKNGKEVGHREI